MYTAGKYSFDIVRFANSSHRQFVHTINPSHTDTLNLPDARPIKTLIKDDVIIFYDEELGQLIPNCTEDQLREMLRDYPASEIDATVNLYHNGSHRQFVHTTNPFHTDTLNLPDARSTNTLAKDEVAIFYDEELSLPTPNCIEDQFREMLRDFPASEIDATANLYHSVNPKL